MTKTINYLIVEDLEIVSLGLKIALEEFSGLNLVGMAKDGEEAVQMALSLNPDLVIMDLGLPKLDGTEATRRIHAANPRIKILIMSSRERPRDIFTCFAAGASGYCRKETEAGKVYEAMRELMGGHLTIDPTIAERIITSWKELEQGPPLLDGDGQNFTVPQKQLQLLELMASGFNSEAIASELKLDKAGLNQDKAALRSSLAALGGLLAGLDGDETPPE